MLGGIDPLLVVSLKLKPATDTKTPAATASLLDSILDEAGLPIPIYLSERGINRRLNGGLSSAQLAQQTGILVDNESKSIAFSTKIDSVGTKNANGVEPDPVEVSQNVVDSSVTVNLLCSRDSVILTVLLALFDQLPSRAVTKEYSIHYLNGPTAIFGAKLANFSTAVSPTDDLVRIDLTLSTASKERTTPKPPIQSVPNSPSSSLTVPPAVGG